jgi:hypothetical protein
VATAPDAAATAGGYWRVALRYGCGTALVLVTAFVVAVVLVIWQWVNAGQQPVQPAKHVPITGSAAVLTDGATIVYSDPGELCSVPHLTAAETSARVVLSLSATVSLGGPGCSGNVAALPAVSQGGPALTGALTGTAAVVLSSPLGDRRLVDAMTGRTIPYFDQGRALLPPQVAGGSRWRAAGFATSAPYFGGPGAVVLAERLLSTNSVIGPGNGMSLLIVQVAGGGWHPPRGTVTTHVLVRGLPGLAAPGIIVWSEAGHTIAVIGEGPYPAGEPAGIQGRPPLPLASLQAIASALTGAGQA